MWSRLNLTRPPIQSPTASLYTSWNFTVYTARITDGWRTIWNVGFKGWWLLVHARNQLYVEFLSIYAVTSPFQYFSNDSKENQNSPVSRLQMTPSLHVAVNKLTGKSATQGDLDRMEDWTKQSPVPRKDKPPGLNGTGCGLVLLGRTCSPGGQNIKREPGRSVPGQFWRPMASWAVSTGTQEADRGKWPLPFTRYLLHQIWNIMSRLGSQIWKWYWWSSP